MTPNPQFPLYILVSGPPQAGKDTVGAIIERLTNAYQVKFAQPLMESAFAFGFDMAEEVKDDVQTQFGISRRDFQIGLSENFAKQVIGPDVFGKALLATTLGQGGYLFVVTDSGFAPEAESVIAAVGVDNVFRLHISRSGTSYVLDSRSDWVTPPGINRQDIVNNGTIEKLEQLVRVVLGRFGIQVLDTTGIKS